jgi:hypothetical protein
MKRISIAPTYDSAKDGVQYVIDTTVNHKSIGRRDIADPFVNHTVRVSWRDTLRGLFAGGVVVSICVAGKNPRIVEDVLELDDQYLGWNADRRDRFVNDGLAALAGEAPE